MDRRKKIMEGVKKLILDRWRGCNKEEDLLRTPVIKCMRRVSRWIHWFCSTPSETIRCWEQFSRRTLSSTHYANIACYRSMDAWLITYIPNGEVIGLSKMARTVGIRQRLQLQGENELHQIASAFMEELKPKGLWVMIEAEHMCMTCAESKPEPRQLRLWRAGFENDECLQAILRILEHR